MEGRPRMRTGTAINLDDWHVSFVGNGRCRFIVAEIIPMSHVVCVCGVCVCVSQTLFQREVIPFQMIDFLSFPAGGHRKPIELCPTKLSLVSAGYQGWSP